MIFNLQNLNFFMFSYFTITTANEALPEVIKKYKFVLGCKAEVMKAEQQLQLSVTTTNNFQEYVDIVVREGQKLGDMRETLTIVDLPDLLAASGVESIKYINDYNNDSEVFSLAKKKNMSIIKI